MPTTDQLLDLEGVGQRSETFRYDVLDRYGNVAGQITPEPGARIENNTNRDVKRTLSGLRIIESDWVAVNWLTERLKVVWVSENGDELPLGVFLATQDPRARYSWGLDVTVEFHDQGLILNQDTPTTIGFPVGSPIVDAVADVAADAGITDFEFTPSDATVGSPIAWPAGTKRLRIVNELAGMAGLLSPFFDNSGLFRMISPPDPATSLVTLRYHDGGRIVPGATESDDRLGAPNQFIVIDGSSTSPIVGVADIPDSAPHSYNQIGFHRTSVVNVQGIGSQEAADAKARALAAEEPTAFEWVTFTGPPDPRHDTFDLVDYRGVVYREQSWTLTLTPGGDHVHELRRSFV